MKAFATTAQKRLEDLPHVPTMTESGFPNTGSELWVGFFVQAKTPRAIVNKLHAAILKVMATPEAKTQLEQQGTDVETNTPEVFKAYIRSQVAIFAEAIKASGAKVE